MSNLQVNSSLANFSQKLEATPESISFAEVMQVITDNYSYAAATFTNGDLINEAGTNEGSCKIFSFAKLNNFTEEQTLACFGKYYREDVLQHPQGDDHGNIRNFIKYGWSKVDFKSEALAALV